MHYRRLGQTDLNISEIGFGTWGIGSDLGGGLSYGPQDDQASMAALEKAFQLGVNFFDTADLYGGGHSERLLGKVFSNLRNEVIISTKAGYKNPKQQDFSAKSVEKALFESLGRLRTDYIDLFLLHNPSPEVLTDAQGLFALLNRLRQEGVIRALGVSARTPDEAIEIVDMCPVDSIQVNLNLTDMRALAKGLLNTCDRRQIGVIIRSPLALGFLCGKLTPDAPFHVHDHRNRFSKGQMKLWTLAADLYRAAFNDDSGATDAQNALRFCLHHPSVTTVIPGMHTVKEVEENVLASSLSPLNEYQLEKIMSIYEQHTFFVASE